MVAVQTFNATLPVVPGGWSAEKDFKSVGALTSATQRNLEPVGPYFLAHARRVCPFSLSTSYYVYVWLQMLRTL